MQGICTMPVTLTFLLHKSKMKVVGGRDIDAFLLFVNGQFSTFFSQQIVKVNNNEAYVNDKNV